jgi:hypothetical protein
VLDAGRDQGRVHRFQLFGLYLRPYTRPPFDDYIQRVGDLQRRPRLRLPRFEADQLADQARAIEDVDPYRPVAQEPARFQELDYFHEGN